MGFILIILLLFVSLIFYLAFDKKEDADKIPEEKTLKENIKAYGL